MRAEGLLSTRAWRVAFVACVVANLALLYWPRVVSPGGVPHLDKVVHLTSFALLALTGLRAGLAARLLLPLLVAHAVTSEVVQETVLPARSGDPADAVADLLGGLVGWGLARASWRHGHRRAAGPAGAGGRLHRPGGSPPGRDAGAG